MNVEFKSDPRGFVAATVQEFSLAVDDLPGGPASIGLLPLDTPFIKLQPQSGATELIPFFRFPYSRCCQRHYRGRLATLNIQGENFSSFKANVTGRLEVATGLWAWTAEGSQCPPGGSWAFHYRALQHRYGGNVIEPLEA